MQNEIVGRSRPEEYARIVQRVLQFKNSVGSADAVSKLGTKVFRQLEVSGRENSFDEKSRVEMQSMIRECEVWLASCDPFVTGLVDDFNDYKDIVVPIVYAVSMVSKDLF